MKQTLFILLVSLGNCFGHDSTRVKAIPVRVVKFSPLHLVNFYPTLQFSYEQRVVKSLTIQVEAGYVMNYSNDNRDYSHKRGFKLKFEPRYYLNSNQRGTFISYFAAEGYYNAVDFNKSDQREECYDLECDHRYIKRYVYKVTYREHGIGIKFGFVKYFSSFLLDINSGWAIRFVDYNKPPLVPEFGETSNNWFNIPREEDRVALMPLLGLRIGYRFR